MISEYDSLFLKMQDADGHEIIINKYTRKAWNCIGLRIYCIDCFNTKLYSDPQDKTIQVCYDIEDENYLCFNPKHPYNKKIR